MGCIVCALRGGAGSRAVQLAAIQRAKETGDRLVFLYVADLSSISQVEEHLAQAVSKELKWMGQALLEIARRRAQSVQQDVSLALIEGEVKAEITRFLKESGATLLMLGAPRKTTAVLFDEDAAEQFAHQMQETTGVETLIVRPETVTE